MTARNKNVRRGARAKEKQSVGLHPIGVIRSGLKEQSKVPKQASEGAPDAWLECGHSPRPALDGLPVGDKVIVLTWFHRAHCAVLKVHPRSDPSPRLTGVFATRSPDRPNPIGLHQSHDAQNKQAAFANRCYRSHRWDASDWHQASAVRSATGRCASELPAASNGNFGITSDQYVWPASRIRLPRPWSRLSRDQCRNRRPSWVPLQPRRSGPSFESPPRSSWRIIAANPTIKKRASE